MTDSMVERVARAMADLDAQEDAAANGQTWIEGGDEQWARLWAHDWFRLGAIKRARAVISAMREPTEAMFDACETRSGAKLIFIRAEWRAMIDAALAEPVPK